MRDFLLDLSHAARARWHWSDSSTISSPALLRQLAAARCRERCPVVSPGTQTQDTTLGVLYELVSDFGFRVTSLCGRSRLGPDQTGGRRRGRRAAVGRDLRHPLADPVPRCGTPQHGL